MINKTMLKTMRKEARRVADAVFAEVGTDFDNPEVLSSALCKLGGIHPEELTSEQRDIMNFGKSMEGICYLLGLELVLPGDLKAFRCAQFTALVDNYLYTNGVKPCSEELKVQYYKQLQLYDLYVSRPELFRI